MIYLVYNKTDTGNKSRPVAATLDINIARATVNRIQSSYEEYVRGLIFIEEIEEIE